PYLARHRYGCRVAVRRRTGDGAMAAALARLNERRVAGLLGSRLPAVERVLLVAVRPLLLVRYAVDLHRPGAGDRLCPLLRQGARSLAREPAVAEGVEACGQ